MHFRVVLKNLRKLVPFSVLAGSNDFFGLLFKPLEVEDLRLQFRHSFGGGRLVDQVFFESFLFLGGEIVFILGHYVDGFGEWSSATDAELFFTQAFFQTLPSSSQ